MPAIYGTKKRELPTIAAKNRIIRNFVDCLMECDNFLIVGHKHPDEDCIASMVAFGLLVSKFNKHATIVTCSDFHDQYRYLLNICKYNSIHVLEGCDENDSFRVQAVVVLDTPKPSMIEHFEVFEKLLSDPNVRKLEIDHHLEADSAYAGDDGYCLVTGASSTCELIGLLAFKIGADSHLIAKAQIRDLFSRNLVLAILTGIIGDSRMGKYLKTKREHWFYNKFSSLFEEMLEKKTFRGKGNYSSMEDVFNAIASLSTDEADCYRYLMQKAISSGHIKYIALSTTESEGLFLTYGNDTIIAVSKSVADECAESVGYIGLISYYDDISISNFAQFRIRRSQAFTSLDLRDILTKLNIENGGGHPGAVGFRFDRSEVPDMTAKVAELIDGIEKMIQ